MEMTILAARVILELVEFLTRKAHRPGSDLEELWSRIVFSIAIHNTDDHLRNHGFLLTDGGWVLSPAYDLNPDPDGTGLSLNISETDNALSFDLALEVAPFFRLKPPMRNPSCNRSSMPWEPGKHMQKPWNRTGRAGDHGGGF